MKSTTEVPAQPAPGKEGVLVRVQDVVKHFPVGGGIFGTQVVHAVDGVSFDIQAGETLGLVGESGSGKSTLGRVIVQLLPATSGSVFVEGLELTKMHGEKLRRVRQRMQMIFQDPYGSLNPRMTVGAIIGEPLRNYGLGRRKAIERAVQEVMRICGLNPNFVKAPKADRGLALGSVVMAAVLLAVVGILFASTHPDGLEKLAQTLGTLLAGWLGGYIP